MRSKLKDILFPRRATQYFIENARQYHNPYISWKETSSRAAEDFVGALKNAEIETPLSEARDILDMIDMARIHQRLPAGILFRQFPVDAKQDLLSPPHTQDYDATNPRNIGKRTFIAEYAMLGLTTAMGLTISVNLKLQSGWMCQHVTPKVGKMTTASHAGTAYFPRHSDGAHFPKENLVDWLGLHTLRNGKTESIIVSYNALKHALLEELGEERFNILRQPRFTFKASDAYDQKNELIAPIIDIDAHGQEIWRIQGNKQLVSPSDPDDHEAHNILAIFHHVLEKLEATHRFPLQYGEALFIDNLRGFVHTRSPIDIKGHQDDAKRHLLRIHGRFSEKIVQQMTDIDNIKEPCL